MKVLTAVAALLATALPLAAQVKVEKDVAYGPHERNVMDIYWKADFKDAPIVITIHGGGFKNGSKAYCNADMQKLFLDKGCVVVSPNYRLIGQGKDVSIADCEIDCAMAVATIQANAKKYGGDPKRIVSTGGSAGGYLSFQVAYRKNWKWPAGAKHTPEKLNVIGWYGDSPYLPSHVSKNVMANDPPGFMIYGENEHPGTPAKQGHDMQAVFKKLGIWSKMVYVKKARHVPGKQVLISARSRNAAVYEAFDQFLDMVCTSKGDPKGGDVITIEK